MISKLDRFPTYEIEYNFNKKIFLTAYSKFTTYLNGKIDKTTLEEYIAFRKKGGVEAIIKYRVRDLLVAITDDLLRYASYHNISKYRALKEKQEKFDPIKDLFSIAEDVRAAFFVKWILKIRPLTLDYFANPKYNSSNIDGHEHVSNPSHLVEFVNEHFALFTSAHILNIKEEGKKCEYKDLFDANELSLFFYALRYRTNHQDAYTMLFKKIKCQSKSIPNSNTKLESNVQ